MDLAAFFPLLDLAVQDMRQYAEQAAASVVKAEQAAQRAELARDEIKKIKGDSK